MVGIERAKELKLNASKRAKEYPSTGRAKTKELEIERKRKISENMIIRYKSGWNQISGFKKTKYYQYKGIKVHGLLELKTCYILDKLKDNKIILNWEYTNDRIQYFGFDNKEHTYLIDFKIFENDGSFYYLEVKGWEQEVDKLKWNETKKQGFKLEIWKTKTINFYLKKYDDIPNVERGANLQN